ncbi:hypothetical protein D3C75_1333540 [compost metagenome]
MILEQHGVPVVIRGIDDSALRHPVIAVAKVIIQNNFELVRSEKFTGTVAYLSSAFISGFGPFYKE